MKVGSLQLTLLLCSSVSTCVAQANIGAVYDPNFACCGGCSSSKRADGYAKIPTGSKVFIWDVALKSDPAPVCLLTFPYDPGLSEQAGERRVRSGRLVGTNYPIDNDYDSLCCEQRGACLALDEDASGRCRCVKRWGFTGDHCQYSIYETAATNNTKRFPATTNLSDVKQRLPDIRHYLLAFDYKQAIRSTMASDSSTSGAKTDSLLGVLETDSYRQYGWSMCVYFVALAVLFILIFTIQICWRFCCFKCGCRSQDPTKQAKVYSKLVKIFWGVLMCIFLCTGAAAAVLSFLTLHSQIIPISESIGTQLKETVVHDIDHFQSAFLTPLNELLVVEGSTPGERLAGLQSTISEQMIEHTFLENQTNEHDVVREPIFAILDELKTYSTLYPTANSGQTNCANMNITPTAAIRMTVGASTGCFRCKTCSTMMDLVESSRDLWKRNPFRVQMDLLVAQRQMLAFASTETTLGPAIAAFRDQISTSCSEFAVRTTEIAATYDTFRKELRLVAFFGLLGLVGLAGLATVLAVAGFSSGLASNKRNLSRASCFMAEIAFLAAVVLVGVLCTIAMMAQDGVEALGLFEANTSTFLGSNLAAQDVQRVLFDANLVSANEMDGTLAFVDTLRVPPHPTASKDDPSRFDIEDLYLSVFQDLFAVRDDVVDPETAIVELFGWDDSFAAAQHALLVASAFGNASVTSPYNETIHRELLDSTMMRLLDPDNDTALATDDDFAEIQTVFNESWRGVADRGAHQNYLIRTQWHFVAQLYSQKLRLMNYTTAVAEIVSKTQPLLGNVFPMSPTSGIPVMLIALLRSFSADDLITKTSAMESAEFRVKAAVEYFTDAIRESKIHDCAYNGNCGWLRASMNELFRLFQELITHAEEAAIYCAISAGCTLFGLIFLDCFATRLRRSTVKVYVGN